MVSFELYDDGQGTRQVSVAPPAVNNGSRVRFVLCSVA